MAAELGEDRQLGLVGAEAGLRAPAPRPAVSRCSGTQSVGTSRTDCNSQGAHLKADRKATTGYFSHEVPADAES
ncbi:hypothetical protein E6W39_08065 [Kitasatospora acidiphila]|uniref:Uncharacterized protein n=1 Tax=Kitasatospora acidiphila TaxID=2567942 RepID=A0A540W1M8_9ACTN|nr:hypothetical protein [Kitasatospora acidiphila]TQF02234.1 hypothetical protein E6W39_08065 [Kitasatospora acidiphila]